jgi:hypothetical protein
MEHGSASGRTSNTDGTDASAALSTGDTDKNNLKISENLFDQCHLCSKEIEKYGSGFIRIRKEIRQYETMIFNYKELGSGFLAELEYSTQKINSGLPPPRKPPRKPH